MLYDKKRYTVTISAGSASFVTEGMKGRIELITIAPLTSSNVWDLTLKDRDGDVIFSRQSETGTLFYIDGLPVGLDGLERLRGTFANVGTNENIIVSFRIKEMY